MRRTLAILAIGGLLATVVGSAAALTVNASVLQYGEDTVTCDTEGIGVNWGLENNDGLVYFVRISDVDPTCAGATMFVTVLGANDVVLFEGERDASNGNIDITPDLNAVDIVSVKVGIEG